MNKSISLNVFRKSLDDLTLKLFLLCQDQRNNCLPEFHSAQKQRCFPMTYTDDFTMDFECFLQSINQVYSIKYQKFSGFGSETLLLIFPFISFQGPVYQNKLLKLAATRYQGCNLKYVVGTCSLIYRN